LKRKSSNHRAKKANVLEITHIDKFLGEADKQRVPNDEDCFNNGHIWSVSMRRVGKNECR
jgi:hypothetical protein